MTVRVSRCFTMLCLAAALGVLSITSSLAIGEEAPTETTPPLDFQFTVSPKLLPERRPAPANVSLAGTISPDQRIESTSLQTVQFQLDRDLVVQYGADGIVGKGEARYESGGPGNPRLLRRRMAIRVDPRWHGGGIRLVGQFKSSSGPDASATLWLHRQKGPFGVGGALRIIGEPANLHIIAFRLNFPARESDSGLFRARCSDGSIVGELISYSFQDGQRFPGYGAARPCAPSG